MSIPARPLYHDYNAFPQADGSVGFRCCGGNSSVPLYKLGALTDDMAQAQRRLLISQGRNPDELWCRGCSTLLEDLRDGVIEGGPALISMVSAVASFIPGIGTAVATVLRSGLALAQGSDISGAFVQGIKGALPGGAATEIAFNAGQAALRGESIQDIVLDGLPIPSALTDLVKMGLRISSSLADGEQIGDEILKEAYGLLPEYGQRAVDIALALNDGRSAAEIISEQTQDQLPPDLRTGLIAGMAVGQGQAVQEGRRQFIGTFGSAPETNVANNDGYFQAGQKIIESGAKYQGTLISDIVKGRSFTVEVDQYDALNGVWRKETVTYTAGGPWASSDAWRRGFAIALAVCDGSSERNPGQTAVYQTMAELGGRQGFDAGQAVQFHRTQVAANTLAAKLQPQEGYAAEKAAQTDRAVKAKLRKIRDDPSRAP